MAARLSGLADLHPHQEARDVQGALRLMVELSEALKEVSGMDAVTLQPAAGAHGELTGLLLDARLGTKPKAIRARRLSSRIALMEPIPPPSSRPAMKSCKSSPMTRA